MRVGVFPGSIGVTEGGGNTLRSSLLAAMQGSCGRHEFIVFRDSDAGESTRSPEKSMVSRLRSRVSSHPSLGPAARQLKRSLTVIRPPGERVSFEERCLRDTDVDLVWFLRPLADPVAVPYIATVWDLEHRKQPYFPEVSVTGWKWEDRERNFRALLPRAARILTGTEAGKREVVAFYGIRPDIVRVVPQPSADEYRQSNRIDVRAKYRIDNPFIFYPAQFWPHKNHANLLLALRLFNDTAKQPIHLVLTGADMGNLSYVQQMIADLELDSCVHLLGFVPATDLADLYRAAVALVYPTLFGPDNLPPLEAFAAGCPVAASRIDGADEQLGDAAVLFNPIDPAAIADAIRTLLDEQIREDLVRKGRERVAQRTPQNYLEQICDVLDEFEPFRRCWGRHRAYP